ncbi:MAG: endonuclease III [Candidatus Rokubacteria bacterium]|nr:endonuclease III [Candidatus Rokubacteria bacterium]
MAPATIGQVVRTLRRHVREWRPTAVSEIAAERRDRRLSSGAGPRGVRAARPAAPDPFRVLIACLLSLRTQDTTTRPAAARLFQLADTPEAMLCLRPRTIERAIFPVGFYRTKARVVLGVCRDLVARFGSGVPDDLDTLLTLKGVGRKTANLVVTVGFGKPGVCVDTHVHRISNRLGFVRTRTPEQTELALRAKLPRRYWLEYNDLLVAFGQNICRPLSPLCSRCPVRAACHRVGVTTAR